MPAGKLDLRKGVEGRYKNENGCQHDGWRYLLVAECTEASSGASTLLTHTWISSNAREIRANVRIDVALGGLPIMFRMF